MTWVTVANSNSCRIYCYQKKPSQFILLKEISHPEIKLKKSDYLTSDKPGHYQTNSTARGAYSPHMDPKEAEINRFYHEIAEELDQGRKNNLYKDLIIITPPEMKGLLLKHINKHVADLITKSINKDFQHLSDKEILTFLKANPYSVSS